MQVALHDKKSHNPHIATLQRLHIYVFRLFRFRSPLLTESIILSLPAGTSMFQFSAFASLNLCIQFRMTALIALPGFPIQKSSGHSSFDNSPKLIAVYYVFHRLSAPRHPPCALYSLISIPLLRNEVVMTKTILYIIVVSLQH